MSSELFTVWEPIQIKMKVLIVTTLICCMWCSNGMSISPTMKYDYNVSLVADDVYNLFWTVTDEDVTFEVHVKTLGYVGFGLSKTGGMKHADIVTGWIKDGKIYFQDRYSTRNAEPEIDESQDWKILGGREEGSYTILKFSRALKNCDPFDIDITDETMRVIYAFNENDPEESTGLPYHGRDHRGTKSFTFISHTNDEEQILPDDAISMDFRVNDVAVPAKHTTYYCKGFRIPKLDKKHHVIMMEPQIQKGNEGLVHHIILYGCKGEKGEMDENVDGLEGDCKLERLKYMWKKCQASLFLYGMGSSGTFMPKEVGIPLGAHDSITHFRIEIHYNNPPPIASDLVDSSGLRLWLTPTLRQYDAWMVLTGLAPNENHVIPPRFDAMTNYAYCPSECLTHAMEGTEASDGVKVFAAAVHSHQLGTKLKLRHFRDGVELPPIIKEDNYDFNFQFMKFLKEPVTLKPTDNLIVECTFNSKDRENLTVGGWSTQDEMCLIFVMYYPRLSNLDTCLSLIPPWQMVKYTGAPITMEGFGNVIVKGDKYKGKSWQEVLATTDWNDKTTRDKFQNAMTEPNSDQIYMCSANPVFFSMGKTFNITKSYKAVDECKKENGNGAANPHVSALRGKRGHWSRILEFLALLDE